LAAEHDRIGEDIMHTMFGGRSRRPAALALALTMGAMTPAAAQQVTELKVGLAALVNTALPLHLAEAGGFYAKQNLKVTIADMGGGTRGGLALGTGELQVMHVGLSGVADINGKGGDLRVIASLSNVMRFIFYSDPKVKSAAELKGGTVGVSSFGSESDSAASLALRQLGLSRSDVSMKEAGGSPQRLAAIKSGAITAAAMNEPASTLAREQGLYPLVDLFAAKTPWLFTGLSVDKRWLDANRPVLGRFLAATLEGAYRGLTDEKWAKEILAKDYKIADPKIADIAFADFKAQMPLAARPTAEAAENVLTLLPTFGVKLKSRNIEDHVDTGVIDALIADGTIATLQRRYGLNP
jgi:ABC-type nitrate/sulfonate/bicarbonate transport system substrate-binding protein